MSLLAKGIFTSMILFGFSSYLSFKHNEYNRYEGIIENAQKNGNFRHFLREIHQKVKEVSEIPPNTSLPKENNYRKVLFSYAKGEVLETGVGLQDNSKFYPNDLTKIVAVDWVQKYIEQGIIRNKLKNKEFHLEDCEKLSFEDNSFDTVVDIFGLQFYANPEKVLQEMRRVCRKDGNVLILAKGKGNYKVLNVYLDWVNPRFICKYGMFINRDWAEIIEKSSFEVITCERKVNGTLFLYILKNNK